MSLNKKIMGKSTVAGRFFFGADFEATARNPIF